MRDRLWRMRRMPQRSHYLDWCEKIKEKYSSKGEYGFAGATLTFLQGEKESEQKKSGEERRLMLFFQNLIIYWQNSIGIKVSIGNTRVLEQSIRTALEIALKTLSGEEEKRFFREVKIARELLDGKVRPEAEMRESQVFRRWQEGYTWEEISGLREIRESIDNLEKRREIRRETARIRTVGLTDRRVQQIQERTGELPESRTVYLEREERKESSPELQKAIESIKEISRIREEIKIREENLTGAEKKLQSERAKENARMQERERQTETGLRQEKERRIETERRLEKQKENRNTEEELRLGHQDHREERIPEKIQLPGKQEAQIEPQLRETESYRKEDESGNQLTKREEIHEIQTPGREDVISGEESVPDRESEHEIAVKPAGNEKLELPESRMVYLEDEEKKESSAEFQKTTESIREISRIREEIKTREEKLTDAEKKFQSERAKENVRMQERERQTETELRQEKERRIEAERRLERQKQVETELRLEKQKQIQTEEKWRSEQQQREAIEIRLEKQKETRDQEEGLRLGHQDHREERIPEKLQLPGKQEAQIEPQLRETESYRKEDESGNQLTKREEIHEIQTPGREDVISGEESVPDRESEHEIAVKPAGNEKLELPESRMVYLEDEEKKESSAEFQKTTESIREISRIREEIKTREEKLTDAEKKFQSERAKEKVRSERQKQTETELRLEKERRIEAESRLEKQKENRNQEEELRFGHQDHWEGRISEKIQIPGKQEIQIEPQLRETHEIPAKPVGNEKLELPESRMVYLEDEGKKESSSEFQKTTESIREIVRIREKIKTREENLTSAEKKLQSERAKENVRVQERERQTETELRLEKERRIEAESRLEKQKENRNQEEELRFGHQDHWEGRISEKIQIPGKQEIQIEPQLRETHEIPAKPAGNEKPELPESRLVYLESEPTALSAGPKTHRIGRADQFLPLTIAGRSALTGQKLVGDRTNIILKSLLTEKIWKNAQGTVKGTESATEKEVMYGRSEIQFSENIKLTDRIPAEKSDSASGKMEQRTILRHTDSIIKLLNTIDHPETKTKLQVLMGNHENTAAPVNFRNLIKRQRSITELQKILGRPENRINLQTIKFQTIMSHPENLRNRTSYAEIVPQIRIPDLAQTTKIQYIEPHGKEKPGRSVTNSEFSEISEKLIQTREETRILRRDSGYARSTLAEQEKKISGLRQELHEQMKHVNEEVKRLTDTRQQESSVRNMADRVMKELQKQFRTEKIRRGY